MLSKLYACTEMQRVCGIRTALVMMIIAVSEATEKQEKQRSQALNINMLKHQSTQENLCSKQRNDLIAGKMSLKAD